MADRISRGFIRKRHRVEVLRIPGSETTVTSVGIGLEFFENPTNLINRATRGLRRPTPPELTIYLREFAMEFSKLCIFEDFLNKCFFRKRLQNPLIPLFQGEAFFLLSLELIVVDIVRVIIPDMDIILDEESNIRIPSQKPEKLSDDSFPVYTFGREEGKSISKIKSELSSEETIRDVSTSEVFVIDTIFNQISTEFEVLDFRVLAHKKKSKF